jgi:hypothetical protein
MFLPASLFNNLGTKGNKWIVSECKKIKKNAAFGAAK